MDMSILSSFAKFHTEIRPKDRTVQQEILDSQKQINKIQKVINNAKYPIKKIATFGNHETRISKVDSGYTAAVPSEESFIVS